MDLLHNLASSVFSAALSPPPAPAYRQAIPVSVSQTSSTFYLWLSVKTFAFSHCQLLGFLCCTAPFCHAPSAQHHAAQLSALVAATFRCLLLGGGKFAFAYCPARRKLWLFVAKLNATRCAVSLSTGGKAW